MQRFDLIIEESGEIFAIALFILALLKLLSRRALPAERGTIIHESYAPIT
jgi:hypothetical protein